MDFTIDRWLLFLVTWQDVRNFILGMLTGFVLLTLFISLMLVTNRRAKRKIFLSKEQTLSDTHIQSLIEEKHQELIDTVKFTDNAYFRVAFDLSLELMQEIASYYFPDSKYPMYELSIQELLDLNYYVTARIETIVNGKIIRHFKNHRISTIVNILQKKKALDNSKLMKLSRKYQVTKLYTFSRAVLNYANPIYWFRKFTIKPSVTLLTKEVCKMIIEIFGEETNKIYSKKIFQEQAEDEAQIEAKIDQLIDEEIADET